MPTATMTPTQDFRPVDVDSEPVEDVVSLAAIAPLDPIDALGAPGLLGTRAEIELELDLICAAMRTFHRMQADAVMRSVAAYSARLTELAVLLHRAEGRDRQYTRIRTQQVERFLLELDRQFKIASRLVEVMRQDLELMK